jgi:hypothetical protein
MRPFKVGDRVKIADACGDVLVTTLLQPSASLRSTG